MHSGPMPARPAICVALLRFWRFGRKSERGGSGDIVVCTYDQLLSGLLLRSLFTVWNRMPSPISLSPDELAPVERERAIVKAVRVLSCGRIFAGAG
jgi:alkylhydroperoxidase family enzyme